MKELKKIELNRTDTEKTVIEKREYNGYEYIDFRQFFLSKDEKWLPTKKGITFSLSMFEALLSELAKQGLL